MVSTDFQPHTHTLEHTHRHTTSRALLTFSHVPLLVRVPAYGSYERPRGKTEQKKPTQENVILTAWIADTHTYAYTHRAKLAL